MSTDKDTQKLLSLLVNRLDELEKQRKDQEKFWQEVTDLKKNLESLVSQNSQSRTIIDEKAAWWFRIVEEILDPKNNVVFEGCKSDIAIAYLTDPRLYGDNHNVIFSCDINSKPCPVNHKNAIKIIPANDRISRAKTMYEATIHHVIQENIIRTRLSPCIVLFKDVFGCNLNIVNQQLVKSGTDGTLAAINISNYYGSSERLLFLVTEQVDGDFKAIVNTVNLLAQKQRFRELVGYTPGYLQTGLVQPVITSVVFQTLVTLMALQNVFPEFRHNDLHCGNVFLANIVDQTVGLPGSEYLRFIINTGTDKVIYDVPHCGLIAKIADFGLSNLSTTHPSPIDFKSYDIAYGLTKKFNHYYDYYVFLAHCIHSFSWVGPELDLFNKFVAETIPVPNGTFGWWLTGGTSIRIPTSYQLEGHDKQWPQIVNILKSPLFEGYVSDGSRYILENLVFTINLQ